MPLTIGLRALGVYKINLGEFYLKVCEKFSTYSQARSHVCAVLDWPESAGQGLYTASQNDQGGLLLRILSFYILHSGCRAWILGTLFKQNHGSTFFYRSEVMVNCEGLIRPVKMIGGGVAAFVNCEL